MIITFLICLFALSNYNVLAKKEAGPVTCGSVIKLVHKETVSKDVPTQIFPYSISIRVETYILTVLRGDLVVDSNQ